MNYLRICGLLAMIVAANPAGAQQDPSEVFEIDAQRSDIHWRVYRDVPLARFGHSHVISVGVPDGVVNLGADPSQASFELEIPVADLIVDDPRLRSEGGEEFSSQPSAEDIAGTRENMLGEPVLDGDRFPLLRVSGRNWTGPAEAESIDLTIEILGRSIEVAVPTQVVIDGDNLAANGSFTLTHETLGMQPFSVMMNAVRVAEGIDFFYEIHAERAD